MERLDRKMGLQLNGGSARIFEFPKRGRFADIRQPAIGHLGLAGNQASPAGELGGGWYHEAAIDEDRLASRRDFGKRQ